MFYIQPLVDCVELRGDNSKIKVHRDARETVDVAINLTVRRTRSKQQLNGFDRDISVGIALQMSMKLLNLQNINRDLIDLTLHRLTLIITSEILKRIAQPFSQSSNDVEYVEIAHSLVSRLCCQIWHALQNKLGICGAL